MHVRWVPHFPHPVPATYQNISAHLPIVSDRLIFPHRSVRSGEIGHIIDIHGSFVTHRKILSFLIRNWFFPESRKSPLQMPHLIPSLQGYGQGTETEGQG